MPSTQQRYSIKEPISEIYAAWDILSDAADAHLCGDTNGAALLFGKANSSAVWNWLNPAWNTSKPHLRHMKPVGDTKTVAKESRDPNRQPTDEVKQAAIARDGHRCRYCGIPVVDADIRKWAQQNYAAAVPWNPKDILIQHAAFQCMWLQYDHVTPHSHGGSSAIENIVVTCALCNFGKEDRTLAELGLSDPRARPPIQCSWDGLERLRVRRAQKRTSPANHSHPPTLMIA